MAFEKETWHLDKKVPISLILAMIAQTGAIFWWASAVENRVGVLETTQARQQVDLDAAITQVNMLNVTLTRIDTTLGFLLDEIRKD